MKCPICQQTRKFAVDIWNLDHGIEIFVDGDPASYDSHGNSSDGIFPDGKVTCATKDCLHEGSLTDFGYKEGELPYEVDFPPNRDFEALGKRISTSRAVLLEARLWAWDNPHLAHHLRKVLEVIEPGLAEFNPRQPKPKGESDVRNTGSARGTDGTHPRR